MKYNSKIITVFTCLIICLSLPLTGCGIKPKSVDAPQGEDKDLFPRTYPSQ